MGEPRGADASREGGFTASRAQPRALEHRWRCLYSAADMVLIGHSQRVSQPLTRTQKRGLAVVAVIAVGLAAWAIARSTSAPVSSNGCVSVLVPSSTGGGVLSHCGAAARSWCQTEFVSTGDLAKRVQAQCRLAGIEPRRS